MATVVIDPVTRIEGHLRITCEVENGKVKNAWNTCTMFRGFEIFMKDIAPQDTWTYAMRICGVCPTPHGINSAAAAEKAMGVDLIPDNARLIRNMLMAAQLGYDSILWLYPLAALDYVNVPSTLKAKTNDPVLLEIQGRVKAIVDSGQVNLFSNQFWDNPGYLLTPEQNLELLSHYISGTVYQQYANQAAAVLAGKFPMIQNLAAGGWMNLPTLEQIIYYQDQMTLVKEFTDTVVWGDLLALASVYGSLAGFGGGVGNFLTWGNFDDKSQKPTDRLFPSGAIFDKQLKVYDVDPAKAQIFTKHSWYPDDLGGGKAPLESGQEPQQYTELPPMDGSKLPEGKYDWTRAARYPDPKGKPRPMEVGPLAEVLVAYAKGRPDVKKYVDQVLAAVGATGNPGVLFSDLGRVAARIIKARVNTDYALQWSAQLLENVNAGDTKVFIDPPNPNGQGTGIGAMDAPRGALSHYCTIANGKTVKYAAVPASNWNLAPRDDNDVRGPVEEALVGVPCPNPDEPLDILRTVRTFDP
jgi:Ni,Fe-hydrogenase I large subunit